MLSIFSEFGLHCAGCGWCAQNLDITGNRTFNEVMRKAYGQGWITAHPSDYDSSTVALCPDCAPHFKHYKQFKYCI